MGENKIIGLLDVVTRMPALEKFSCYDCGLTGPIPTTIGSMDNLKWFDLRRNEMSGSLPSELGLCNNLEGFTVGDNDNLTGPVPTELFLLPDLEALGLYGTDLSGRIPCDVVRAATIDCGKIECSPCCIQGFDEGIIQLFVPFECPP
uniref:L domain-like protein n=1 Tax=Grammatophora oceanica TaxID=210454 RepID=A0A7S1VR70_9STRA|mmetsp:Transcript_53749/g.80206  ORF Transcript_53749/g.80206 Transcript_53749/m.80206 type:complete len:147 (+) Transcript_53749:775-1215(+)